MKKEERRDEPRLVYIRYLDHVLFRNMDTSEIKLAERVVGWLTYQDQEKVLIQTEKSANHHRGEFEDLASGFLIERNCIKTIAEINLDHVLDKLTSDFNLDRYTKKQVNENE
jgi:hypothetical protein